MKFRRVVNNQGRFFVGVVSERFIVALLLGRKRAGEETTDDEKRDQQKTQRA